MALLTVIPWLRINSFIRPALVEFVNTSAPWEAIPRTVLKNDSILSFDCIAGKTE